MIKSHHIALEDQRNSGGDLGPEKQQKSVKYCLIRLFFCEYGPQEFFAKTVSWCKKFIRLNIPKLSADEEKISNLYLRDD